MANGVSWLNTAETPRITKIKTNLTFCFLGSRSNTFFHMPSFPAAFIRILPFNIPNLQPFLQRLIAFASYRISP